MIYELQSHKSATEAAHRITFDVLLYDSIKLTDGITSLGWSQVLRTQNDHIQELYISPTHLHSVFRVHLVMLSLTLSLTHLALTHTLTFRERIKQAYNTLRLYMCIGLEG